MPQQNKNIRDAYYAYYAQFLCYYYLAPTNKNEDNCDQPEKAADDKID